jgi:putative sugar O-methyltransferase
MSLSAVRSKLGAVRRRLRMDPVSARRLRAAPRILRAAKILSTEPNSVLFATSLLRAREIKMAAALRKIGWKVVLVYIQTTPFRPENHFDVAIQAASEAEAHIYARLLGPRVCHVFSGAVDGMIYRFCADKPAPVVIDMNDVFCATLFDYLHERFEPTRECLERADGLCARDLQAKSAQRYEAFGLPGRTVLFPEYSSRDGPREAGAAAKLEPDEVHVVSVGTFCLESQGLYDSGYLRLAQMLTERRIHFHIYPHWFYRRSRGSVFNRSVREDFVDFFRLAKRTPYLHIYDSLDLDQLARELPRYDFGIIAGGSAALGQRLKILKPEYMRTCFSGRISDYLDARLPVLINREVAFNFRLLKRYGVMVDLGGIHEPGFRERLLELKQSSALTATVERAAQALSIDAHVGRLAAFYEKVVADTAQDWVRMGYPYSLFRALPVIGKTFRRLEDELLRASRRASGATVALAGERRQSRRRIGELGELLRRQRELVDQLQSRLDETGPVTRGRPSAPAAAAQALAAEAAGDDVAVIDRPRKRRSIVQAKRSLEVERGEQWADELVGLLNWTEIADPVERENGMPELMEMIRLFGAGSGATSDPSSCWQVLGFKNFNQLLRDGYSNFKRTVGCSYFNFLVQGGDPQIAFLERSLDRSERERCAREAAAIPDDPGFAWHDQRTYRYFVLMLWAYAKKIDVRSYLDRLEEPEEGRPLTVPAGRQRASQDLANSVLEYYSMAEGVDFASCRRVLEIGGGYGRDAFVVLKLNPHIKYTLVDIPPALWIAQRYLSSVFPDRKVFRVRDFRSHAEVAAQMDGASIVCLLPHQLELMPDHRFDLGINISSFGEMQQEQIAAYFRTLERVTNGHFFMKQWKVSQNAFDNLSLTEESYPVPRAWRKVYSRSCAVQAAFFEALYRTG